MKTHKKFKNIEWIYEEQWFDEFALLLIRSNCIVKSQYLLFVNKLFICKGNV